ncbi:MAG: hypothetical protein ACR2GY_00625 [Phycisphaerales bacterium]
MSWLKRAFAIDRGQPTPDAKQLEVIERACTFIVKRRMVTPALMFLEMSRPLNYVASQTMHFFLPIVKVVADTEGIAAFARFLEHRGSMAYLIATLERMEADRGQPQQNDEQHDDDGDDTAYPSQS